MGEPVDTQDLQWQADTNFAPDKAAEWKYPMEKDGWVHAHNSIRQEMARFRESLAKLAERRRLSQWEIDCLQVAWDEHQKHIHAHHSNEEDLMVPFLDSRIKSPKKLHDDHATLLRALEDLQRRIQGLQADHWEQVPPLHEAWAAYEEMTLPHLREEELIQLPLMRAYFTPKEIDPVVQKILGRGPPVEVGSFVSAMGDEAMSEFMKQQGIPWFVWYLEFKPKRDRFRKLFLQNLDAVAKGQPPKAGGGLFACCQSGEGVQVEEVDGAKQ